MNILAIALGGCLRGVPRYGITEDTGGHITYVLGACTGLAMRADVSSIEIVTRRFDHPAFGAIHMQGHENLAPGLSITRIDSGNLSYLTKDALANDLPAFTASLIADLRTREQLPDIIHAHFSDAAIVADAIRDALNIPYIYTAHSLGIDKRNATGAPCSDLAQRIEQEDYAIASADAIIGSSRDECERQLNAYSRSDECKVHRVSPGIQQIPANDDDLAAARSLIEPFLRSLERPLILAIARPVRKKNLAGLVKAYAETPGLRDKANLVILPGLRECVGAGEAELVAVMRELIDLVDGHDLHGHVAYPRQHCQKGVRGLYALAAGQRGVFVNPALTEPFGLTLLEAAVHGLPVVATRNGGPSDIVGELRHGLTIDPCDTSAMGAAIERLLSDRELWHRSSANARGAIGAFTWDSYADGFVQVARTIKRRSITDLTRCKPRHLLVCDIDNTLTGCSHSARRLANFLRGRTDLAFGVATGRSLIEARRLLCEWGLPDPTVWISAVGTEIHWDRDSKLESDDGYATLIENSWASGAVVGTLDNIPGLTLQPAIEQRAFKRSYFLDRPGDVAIVAARLDAAKLKARIVFSHDNLLDILPYKAGKGAAVRHVARMFGLPMSSVIVAGDSGNDIDMLAECPNGIIVANHEPALLVALENSGAYLANHAHAAGVLEGLIAFLHKTGNSVELAA